MAERFLAPSRRAQALATCVLWQALADAAWAGEDARPGLAKLAWWQQELDDWASGGGRHPLAAVLAGNDPRWAALARALVAWPELRERPGDDDERDAVLMPASRAFAMLEGDLGNVSDAEADAALARHALARLRLLHALARGADAMPLSVGDARVDAQVMAWRTTLARPLPGMCPARVHSALQHALLARHARGHARGSPWRWPFVCWRAARSARTRD